MTPSETRFIWLQQHPWYATTDWRWGADANAWNRALAAWWQATLGWTDWQSVYYDRHAV